MIEDITLIKKMLFLNYILFKNKFGYIKEKI